MYNLERDLLVSNHRYLIIDMMIRWSLALAIFSVRKFVTEIGGPAVAHDHPVRKIKYCLNYGISTLDHLMSGIFEH